MSSNTIINVAIFFASFASIAMSKIYVTTELKQKSCTSTTILTFPVMTKCIQPSIYPGYFLLLWVNSSE